MGLFNKLRKKKREHKEIILDIIIAIQKNLEQTNITKEAQIVKNKDNYVLQNMKTLTKQIKIAKYNIGILVRQNQEYNTEWWEEYVLNQLNNAFKNKDLEKRTDIINTIIKNIKEYKEKEKKRK